MNYVPTGFQTDRNINPGLFVRTVETLERTTNNGNYTVRTMIVLLRLHPLSISTMAINLHNQASSGVLSIPLRWKMGVGIWDTEGELPGGKMTFLLTAGILD